MGYMRDINAGYRMIRRELEHNGAKLYNLSQISTVEPVEKISIEEFKNL
jgi:hypothetical protein